MRGPKLSRRSLLSGVAGTAISLPWLEAMSPIRRAHGQAGKPPLRFVAFVVCEGVFPERFWPRLPGEALFPLDQPPKQRYVGGSLCEDACGPVAAADRSDFIFSPGLEPLSRHRDDLLIVEGLDASGGPGHDHWPSMLTGRTGRLAGISLDQAIANQIAGDTKFKSLELGVRTDNGIPFSCYGVDQPALQENNPAVVFDRVFSEVAPPDPAAAGALNRLRAERKSVLDAAMAEITDLQGSLGHADRQKLQNYFDSIRQVEARLDSEGSGTACGRPPLVVPDQNEWWRSDANIPQVLDAQFDMLAMAFACDLTRVATVSIGNNNCDITAPFLGISSGSHTRGHYPDDDMNAQDDIAKVDVWTTEQLAKFIDRLKAIPEGDGTVFDNTLILWVRELTKGNSHSTNNIPHVMAGSAQGYFKTGRYLRLPRDGQQRGGYRFGRWSNDLKLSVLQAMGSTEQSFGDPDQFGSALDILRG